MAVTNHSVLKRMANEIQEAMLQHGNEQRVREHVRSVKLLAELLLEEDAQGGRPEPSVNEPTAEEIRKMMGADKAPAKQSQPDTVDHEEANGPSIFDF
ncbi:hypothetical protein GLW04_10440 [Halobacillus litoralis]|uniref:YwdI family protein n=1 Tax=Halobacillus litoralis TaxID=45668 RepID=A0A845E1Z1_9BACI|nr:MULTISPECIES: DUF5327 family protein [Halobacillus]MCA1020860.1 YwdI family protein [Halobacillus litoralis]MYL20307.1 hypothetical protein [Halobacillus litoralis]MYL29401.1 hypothetical protein [Halobacillus halophilus]MYL36618.1 hypothetical protein [Halobacillus litoralis]